jgi:hypothetical protein
MAEKRAVTLTRCWSRDEIGIMSLSGQGKGLCHSTNCVFHGMRCDESARTKRAVLLTSCLS